MSKSFTELEIRPEIVDALRNEGIVDATEIQEKTIPLIKAGHDIVGIAKTGSGKTACFGLPLLEKVLPGQSVQGLILAPTRELADQIGRELQKWSKHLGLRITTIFGGVSLEPQAKAAANSEIVVGTPGRILDHLSRGSIDFSHVHYLVLDEADKMVEMGFIEDVERIISATPTERQTLLFGATISTEIDNLKERHMQNVAVAEAETMVEGELLQQFYYNVKSHEKFSLLVHLLKKEEAGKAIIFCSKRSLVELVHRNLRDQGIKAEMIHGKMRQNKRLQTIERFNEGRTPCMVASAVAARGLDIQDVTHVFNYDLANDPQEYIHRVGRTARAGKSGKAITLLAEPDYEAFDAIFRHFRVNVEELPLEGFQRLPFRVNYDAFRQRRPTFGHSRNNNFRGRSEFSERPMGRFGLR